MPEHISVMPKEAAFWLKCSPGGVYVDGTLGGGGHAKGMLDASAPDGVVIGIDKDDFAIKTAGDLLAPYGRRFLAARADFKDMGRVARGFGYGEVDGFLLDLGVSSFQLDEEGRGFGFKRDEPLDMRMDRSQLESAYDLVNGSTEAELARIFRDYGEEPRAKRIARAIVFARGSGPIKTTGELARIVEGVCAQKGPRRIHPATLVFQALRIAVNKELESLEEGLASGVGLLRGKGRGVVISFHSLEDRIVKESFRALERPCVCPPGLPVCACGREPVARVLTKKPVLPSAEEVGRNPRSRSAKLRAVEKL